MNRIYLRVLILSLISLTCSAKGLGTVGGQPVQDPALYKMVGEVTLGMALCSGVRIAPGWILTAAHCVRNGGSATSVAFLSADAKGAIDQNCSALRTITYPGWDEEMHHIPDLALVEINCKAPSDLHFYLPKQDGPLAPGIPVSLAGYGQTIPELDFFTTVVESVSDQMNDPRVTKAQRNLPAWKTQWDGKDLSSLLLTKSAGNHRNGEGDSGGAIYTETARGQYTIWGIIQGSVSPTGNRDDVVADIGTRVSSQEVLKFISTYVK